MLQAEVSEEEEEDTTVIGAKLDEFKREVKDVPLPQQVST
jgi:hypothetical protein